MNQNDKPIPRFVFDSPVHLDALSVPLRLAKYKQLVREAARIARNETLTNNADEYQARCTVFASIARCALRNTGILFDVLNQRPSLAAPWQPEDAPGIHHTE